MVVLGLLAQGRGMGVDVSLSCLAAQEWRAVVVPPRAWGRVG